MVAGDSRKSIFVGLTAAVFFAAPAVFASSVSPLICANPGSTTSTSNTFLNANSCLDYSNSFTQGQNNWFYGYFAAPNLTPGGFTPMTKFTDQTTGDSWWAVDFNKYWTALDAYGGHPNGVLTSSHPSPNCDPGISCGDGSAEAPGAPNEIQQWAVRQYVVPTGFAGGVVKVALTAQLDPRSVISNPECKTNLNVTCPDGSMNEILLVHNGVVTNLGTLNLAYAVANPQTISAQAFVQAGDIIEFVLAPGVQYLNDYGDGTFQLDTVTSVPEPATVALLGGAMLLLLLWKRRRAQFSS